MFIALALSITLALEGFMYNFLKPWNLKLFLITISMNLVLNPLMNILLLKLATIHTYSYLLFIFEIITSLIETMILFIVFKKEFAFIMQVAFLANLSSFLVGDILNQFVLEKQGALFCSLFFVLITAILFAVDLLVAYSLNKKDNSNHYSRDSQAKSKDAHDDNQSRDH